MGQDANTIGMNVPKVPKFAQLILTWYCKDQWTDELLGDLDEAYKDNFYEKAFYDLKKECNAILVGVAKTVDGERLLHKNPENSVKIEKGDYLLVIVNGPAVKRIAKYFGIAEGINE